jgi:arylsulfatase A-like enzyme
MVYPRCSTGPVVLALLAAAAAGGSGCARAAPQPANVVLLCLDTLRADHLGAYGYERDTSPTIDALAAESVVFERAIAQASSTLPSHRALFQSRLASHTTEDAPVLAEVLARAGFRTAAFTGGGNVSAAFGFARGFEVYDEDRGGLPASLPKVEAWLREHAGERFFLFLHTYDIHLPYDPPPPFDTMFGEAYAGPVTGPTSRRLLREQRGLDGADRRSAAKLTPADRDRLVALYDGGVRYTDGNVAALRALLERLGLDGTTALVLYSDHGEEFLDHGSWIHSHTVYDELVRVPLIWHAPRLAPGRVMQQVRLVDVAPTLLHMLGVPLPTSFAGRSLAPLLARRSDPARPAVSEMGRNRSLAVWPWKLVLGAGAPRLFDLSRDPRELRNLAAKEPERVARLSAELAEALGPHASDGVEALDPRRIEPRLRDRLRELGYLDSGPDSSR